MLKILKNIIITLSFLMISSTGKAETLFETLTYTNQNNPTLNAKRNEYKAFEQNVFKAFGGFLPNIDIYGQKEETTSTMETDGSGFLPGGELETDASPLTYGIQAEQPIFTSGKNYYQYKSAKRELQAQAALLKNAKQQILTSAANAYISVLQRKAELDLRTKSENIIAKQLKAAQARFKAGSASKTDILRAKSSLSAAKAKRIEAKGLLNIAEANFESIVGKKPKELIKPESLEKKVPQDLNQFIKQVEKNNPILMAANYQYEAAQNNTGKARGSFLPDISIKASMSKSEDYVIAGMPVNIEESKVGIYGSMPIFAKGQNIGNMRQALYNEDQARDTLFAEKRNAREKGLRAWEAYQSAKAAKEAYIENVQTAKTALKGVKLESRIGRKSIIDFLEAEEEYLTAEVDLLQAKKTEFIAGIELFNTMGNLSLKYFKKGE